MPLLACPDCDLLQLEPPVPEGGSAYCPRCDALLWRHRHNCVERTLALSIAGVVLFAVSNAFPFLGFDMQGQISETTLAGGIESLYDQGHSAVAGLVLLTTIVAPATQLFLLIYVLGPLYLGRRAPGFIPAFRFIERVAPWSMMEVFLIGIIVALVKLADMAAIIPGPALWSFAVLIPVLAGALSSLDPREIWENVEVRA